MHQIAGGADGGLKVALHAHGCRRGCESAEEVRDRLVGGHAHGGGHGEWAGPGGDRGVEAQRRQRQLVRTDADARGGGCAEVAAGRLDVDLREVDTEAGVLVLRRSTAKGALPDTLDLIPGKPIQNGTLRNAVAAVIDEIVQNTGKARAVEQLLTRSPPQFRGGLRPGGIVNGDGDLPAQTSAAIADMADTTLAIQGPPPAAWMTAAPSSSIPKDEALALIRAALPERYRDDDAPVIITDSADGWEGWVEWCCPDTSDPLDRESTDELEIHYRLPVTLTEDRRVQLGAPYAKEVEMIGDFHPAVRRDLDGDGTLEVFWKGCSHYWTHDDKEVASNAGDCCGC